MTGNTPDEEYIDPHGECAAQIAALQAHIGVLTIALRKIADTRYSERDEPFDDALDIADKALSTPVSDVLLSARREGAEAAAKVADNVAASEDAASRRAFAANRFGVSTCRDAGMETAQRIAKAIRSLYPAEGGHHEK